MRWRGFAAGVLVAVAAIVLPGCSSEGSQAQVIAVETTEFAFTPTSFEVKAGDVTFSVQNKGVAEHNFAIEDDSGKQLFHIPVVLPGKTEQLKVTLTPGKYAITCTLPGHKDGGMNVPLVVN